MNLKRLISLCAGVALATAASAFAQTAPMQAQTAPVQNAAKPAKKKTPAYTQTNLVTSGKPLKGKLVDKNLLNPWGLVQGPTPFWISDNNAGVSTLYDGNGKPFTIKVGKKKVPFVVTIPPPGSSNSPATPTGIVFNATSSDFMGDLFIFSTEDGTISGWQPSDNATAVRHVDNSTVPSAANGAVYKGLALAPFNGKQMLYATNFRAGTVDVFDGGYNPVTSLPGNFTDPNPIAGFAPFGITLFGANHLWVTYAMQDGPKHDPVHQAGAGYIDIFTTDGVFTKRFATGGSLNAPWGMVLTPTTFGPLGGDFWIGNFGDGAINTFDATGTSTGQPTDSKGKPLNVDGLWALVFGNGSNNAATTSLYFTAGPNMETEGIFGKFEVTKSASSGGGMGPY